jgi:hypothetical protein
MKFSTMTIIKASALFLLVSGAEAQEFDNGDLRAEQLAVLATHNFAVGAGLTSSGPLGTAVELTEFAANLGLKALPPVLQIPGDITRFPDRLADSSFACDYSFSCHRRRLTTKTCWASVPFAPCRKIGAY